MKRKMSNFGFSTLLLGFTMICIVIFSVLALITANSDYKLSQKVADKNQIYYESQKKAYANISEIDTALLNAYRRSSSEDEYYTNVTNDLSQFDYGYFEVSDDGNLFYNFLIELSDTQTLQISLQICYPITTNDKFYTITKWQTITDTYVEDDDTLNLIGMIERN